jgi:hypothetical protein
MGMASRSTGQGGRCRVTIRRGGYRTKWTFAGCRLNNLVQQRSFLVHVYVLAELSQRLNLDLADALARQA